MSHWDIVKRNRCYFLAILAISIFGLFIEGAEAKDPEWKYLEGMDVHSVDISSDGKYIAAGANDDRIYLFENNSKIPLWNYDAGSPITSISISADGEYIVAGSGNGIYLFNKNESSPIWKYSNPQSGTTRSIAISADGEYIVAGYSNNRVYFFHNNDNNPVWSYTTGGDVQSVDISADGEYIVAGSDDNNVYLFDINGNRLWSHYTSRDVSAVAISNDGEYIVAGSDDNYVYLFSRDKNMQRMYDTSADVTAVDISADGDYFVSGSAYSGSINLFSKNSSVSLWTYNSNYDVQTVAISADGRYITAGTHGGEIYLFDKDNETSPSTPIWISDAGFTINSIAISADGEYIVSGTGYEILLLDLNIPPMATIDTIYQELSFFLYTAELNTTVFFKGIGSDVDGVIVAYEWNSSIDGLLSIEINFNSSNLSFGHHIITFRVQDDTGEWGEVQSYLEIYVVPVAFAGDDISVSVGETFQFTGLGDDVDGYLVLHEWDFDGDGFYEWSSNDINHNFGGGLTNVPIHYNKEGTYTAVLRVTDDSGYTATDSRTVTVEGEGFLPAPSILAALGVLLAIAKRRKY